MYFPEYIKAMSKTKSYRARLRSLARKVARHLHVSIEYAKTSFLPYFRIMAGTDNDLIFNTIYEMQLNMEETSVLLKKDNVWSLWKQYQQFRAKKMRESIRGARPTGDHLYMKGVGVVESEDEAGKLVTRDAVLGDSIVPLPVITVDEEKKEEEEKKKEEKGKKAQISLDSFF